MPEGLENERFYEPDEAEAALRDAPPGDPPGPRPRRVTWVTGSGFFTGIALSGVNLKAGR